MRDYQVQYFDAHTILIVNSKGTIRKLQTPFRVRCCKAVGVYREGVYLYVDEVGSTEKDQLIYYVGDTPYYHHHFRVVADF
jgi:hypothetical protein